MSLPWKLLYELERKGAENDFATENKQEKYLNISRETGEFLSLFLKAVRAKKVLEFGTSNGYSTIWLALGLPNDGRLVTIENSYAKIQEAKKNFEAASVNDKISILEINFEDYLKKRTISLILFSSTVIAACTTPTLTIFFASFPQGELLFVTMLYRTSQSL
ncbi:hypothetical protein KZO25_13710 [Halomonas sp. ANAO-440]|nr:hypothetical protein [Halomonas sp. ANAO-440]MBZ0331371.1 hypothetical protein [Halomonas sp. ANAO-440]